MIDSAILALYAKVQMSKMLWIEAALTGVMAPEPSVEMQGIATIAPEFTVSASTLWSWYRTHKVEFGDFVSAIYKAQYYAEAEGLLFECVALDYLREATQ